MRKFRYVAFCTLVASLLLAATRGSSARTSCYWPDACFYQGYPYFSTFISLQVPNSSACTALCANGGSYDGDLDYCECHNISVSLESHDGDVITANGGGGAVRADATSVGYDETFGLINWDNHVLHDGDFVTLTTNGYAFSTASSSGVPLKADASGQIGSTERFIINTIDCSDCDISSGDAVLFRSDDGSKYWTALNGGGSTVEVGPTDWAGNEEFRIWFQ
jgi:hypothetical protein